MLTGTELGAAIESARLKKNVTKKAMASAFGVAPPSVQGWVNTGRIDKSKLIQVIRYFSDVVGPEHWGLSRDDNDLLQLDDDLSSVAPQSAADIVRAMLETKAGKSISPEARERLLLAADEAQPTNVITADFSRRPIRGDEIRIAHYDVRGAMGSGKLVREYPEMLRDVTVSQEHLRELGVKYQDPAHLKVITGDGESMAPTIKHLDPLIVDASIREFTGDGIYAFTWQGLFYIKRLQMRGPDHFRMLSDNTLHPPEDIRVDETYIQARVLLVWNARRV
ncbi:S24 family peptidase [Pseudomonas otitidis]|uniref:S24 family peptidase n=1 Tax=Metapseudomonas otitidis TaxID=319939 RepID=UPI00244A4AB0|nr:S24 family peptidase [Pseudomonas otitidis]MDH1104806.1 S24 family peptidase [Pseudomonas otitidis]MDH1157093.1 S24 family peptidase [Pseudomonas otitidis]MDH1164717.1 S24 family peptidase [Pseudomonas otitidis]